MTTPYFAVDPLDQASAAGMLDVWRRAQQRLNGGWLYALIDSAFDEEICRDQLSIRKDRAVSLYDGTEFDELVSVSPWLVRLTQSGQSDDECMDDIARLCAFRGTRPMLSFIASRRDLVQLKVHFRPFLQVVTEDGMPMLLRFADTRVVEPLLKVFTPEQRAAFLPSDIGFWFPQRRSPLIGGTLPGLTASPAIDGTNPVQLNDAQFAALMDSSDVDLVVQRLIETERHRFAGHRPSKVHAFVADQISRARRHGLHDMSDLEVYCNSACSASPSFDEHPAFAFAIRQASRSPGTLEERFAEMPIDAWDEAVRPGPSRGAE